MGTIWTLCNGYEVAEMLLRVFLVLIVLVLVLVLLVVVVVPIAIPLVWNALLWREATTRWLRKKQTRKPNEIKWSGWLGFVYQSRMLRSTGEAREEAAQQVVEHYERWLQLHGDVTNDYSRLDDLAMAAVEAGLDAKAKMYAMQLLQLPGRYKGQQFGNAIHYGNIVLGRLALRQGNLAKAKEYLLNAGATPGSPQLISFGPNMILANELLKVEEREVVLQYFDLCSAFWTLDKKWGLLRQWASDVREGRMPNFGNNLNRM